MDLDRENEQCLPVVARYKFCVNLPLSASPEVQKTETCATFLRSRAVRQFFKTLTPQRLKRSRFRFFQSFPQGQILLRIHRID